MAFRLRRELRVLNLCDTWPIHARGNHAIHSGSRVRAREWSRLIYDSYGPQIGGLLYPSSLTGRDCLALYESCETALPPSPTFHRALADPTLTAVILAVGADLGYAVI